MRGSSLVPFRCICTASYSVRAGAIILVWCNSQADEPPADYSLEAEKQRWKEWTQAPGAHIVEHDRSLRPGFIASASMFLALVDDDHHELIPQSHVRFRTPLEHDVLLPQIAKDDGVPHQPLWDGESVLPGTTKIRLRAGECFVRDSRTIHRGHPSGAERLTLAGGWSAELSPQQLAEAWANPRVEDVRRAWTHDPAIREALPTEWMKDAYDRWKKCFRLGTEETDLHADWVLATRRGRGAVA